MSHTLRKYVITKYTPADWNSSYYAGQKTMMVELTAKTRCKKIISFSAYSQNTADKGALPQKPTLETRPGLNGVFWRWRRLILFCRKWRYSLPHSHIEQRFQSILKTCVNKRRLPRGGQLSKPRQSYPNRRRLVMLMDFSPLRNYYFALLSFWSWCLRYSASNTSLDFFL